MPISLSSKRSLRKSQKNRGANLVFRTGLKKTVKEFLEKPTGDNLKKIYSVLDKAKKKNIFHLNKVARLKSEYAKKVKVTKTETSVKKKKTAAKKMS